MCRVCTCERVQASIAWREKPSEWSSLAIVASTSARSGPTTVQKVSTTLLLAGTLTRQRSAAIGSSVKP